MGGAAAAAEGLTLEHAASVRGRGRPPARLIGLVAALAAAGGVGIGVGLHAALGGGAAERGLSLPAFHGSASWAPRQRPAPRFALRDQDGRSVSLAALRGRPVVVTFLDSRCREQCPLAGRELGSVVGRLPVAERPVVLIVSVNPAGDTRRSVRAAARRWGLTGDWHWLLGTAAQTAPVWRAYGIQVRPGKADLIHTVALFLVDRQGFERSGYLFPFAPAFVERDLRTLAKGRA